LNIGFIGFGEAAFNLSMGLFEEGVRGIRATDTMADHPVMGRLIHERSEAAQVELMPTAQELVEWADIFFTPVPTTLTVDLAKSIRDQLKPGKIYADVSASTPKTKETIWEIIKDTGVLFADAALLGSLPASRHKVPILVSGNGAQAFMDAVTPLGMNVSVIGDKPGDASAIKLIRSIYMKGVAALMVEMLQAADAYGVSDKVIASVAESMDASPFVPAMNRLVTGTAIHCVRRAAELKGSIELLEEAGLDPSIVAAAKQIHESLEKYNFAEKNVTHRIKQWEDVIIPIRPDAQKEE
jgi:3-hydroxyisobutyrate dehydrogenase-like beta-hydroxyacid dehydrogenase